MTKQNARKLLHLIIKNQGISNKELKKLCPEIYPGDSR